MLKNDLTAESAFEPEQVIYHIFVRPKKDGSYRIVLNMKPPNEHAEYKKFKMETLQKQHTA